MKKALIAVMLVLSMVIPAFQATAMDDRIDVPDTALNYSLYKGNLGLVNDLNSTSTSKGVFKYSVPKNGATVIVFFVASGNTVNSGKFIDDLATTKWASDSSVNLIAVDSSRASKQTVQNFISEHDKSGLIDHVYYNEDSNALIAWYLTSIEKGGNMKNVRSFSVSASFAHVLVITEQYGVPMINYSLTDVANAEIVTSRIASLIDIPDGKNDEVTVKIAGYKEYGNVEPVVDLVNQNRAEAGLAPLTVSSQLTELAMQRAAECVVYYSHTRPDGNSCFTIGQQFEYPTGTFLAENIACGQPTPEIAVESWMKSTGHRANIMNASYTQIGIGCVYNNGTYYWVQVFGDGNDTTSLVSTESVYTVCTIKTLESRINDRTNLDGITLWTGGETECFINNKNMGPGESYNFIGEFIPVATPVYDDDGNVIANLGDDGTLTAVQPGRGVLNLKAYETDKTSREISVTVIGHVWDNGVVTKEATCDEDGVMTYTCARCGLERYETIPGGHIFSEEFTIDVPATYKRAGSMSRHCERCNERIDVTEIPMLISTLRGDVDGDGEVTMKDVLRLRRIIAGLETLDERYAANADLRSDGEYDMKDVLTLRRIIAGLEK